MGPAGDVDPAHSLEPSESSNHCQSRSVVAPKPYVTYVCLVIQAPPPRRWTLTRMFPLSQEQHHVQLLLSAITSVPLPGNVPPTVDEEKAI